MSLLFHWIIDHTVFIYMGKIVFLSLSKKTTSFVYDAIKKDGFSVVHWESKSTYFSRNEFKKWYENVCNLL